VLRYFHLLAMAFFVGGQIMLAAAVLPALRGEAARPQLRAVARRFGWGTLAAIAVLVATGIPLASEFGRWSDGLLQTKLALVAAVAALTVWHMRRPDLHALEAGVFIGSLAIVWLGVSLAH
jgi:uncharacterized membrane protein